MTELTSLISNKINYATEKFGTNGTVSNFKQEMAKMKLRFHFESQTI